MEHTTQSQLLQEEHTVLLARARTSLPMLSLDYRLQAVMLGRGSGGLWITVETDEDRERAYAGEDLARAITYFDRIVEGGVTPCTLQDVVSDLQWEETH